MKTMLKPLLVAAVSTLALGVSAAPSQAVTTLIGNIPSTTYTGGRAFDSPTDVLGAAFIIPAGSTPYRLDSATLIINYLDTSNSSTPQLTLRSATNGTAANSNPGAIIPNATFTSPTFNTNDPASTAYTFTNQGFILQPGTAYFLTLSVGNAGTSTPGTALWNWRQGNPAVAPTGMASIFGTNGYRFSNTGVNFGNNLNGSDVPILNSYSITATAVPLESDALPILISMSLFGGGIWVKRKLANKGKIEIDS